MSARAAASDGAAPLPRFTELGLSETMLAALASVAYEMPTPVQAGIIPRALAGVAFFFKPWGGTNKKKTGRLFEGRTWDELPRMRADEERVAV